WARGVVVDGRGGRVAIVALDLVGYFKNEIDTIRALVPPEAGVDYVVVHSTHQHEGPDTLGLWGPSELQSGIDFGYLDFVNAAVADCIGEAAGSLQKARLRLATTSAEGLSLGLDAEDDGFGVADGTVLAGDAALAPATEGRIVDPRLAVMQFTARRPEPAAAAAPPAADALPPHFPVLATLVNFASHPESLGASNTQITSDFPHYARERLEQEYGGLAIWVSADLGVLQGPLDIDVLDPATGMPAPRRTFRFAEVHGTQLAERVIGAVDTRRPGHPAPRIDFARATPVAVPLDNPFFRLFTALGVLNPRRSLFTDGVPDPSVGFPLPAPFDTIPQALGEDIQTEVGAIRIGGASVAVVPTELDPQIGVGYRDRMPRARHTFIVGLGNDHIGYQVPEDKWDPSCFQCFPFVVAGIPGLCPVQPIDCNTVFQNNVGPQVSPAVSDALLPLIDALH
ncbi:MAG: hypothetical protein R3263_11700, partial [Myxococcota bacterium]|nr:hypothetical protein [Myxococcota bacterium]